MRQTGEADDDAERLDAETVFGRLEQLRELLRLTDYLAGFRPVRRDAEPTAPADDDPARR